MRPLAPPGPVTRRRPVDDPAVRLFLLHHAGGSHLLYRGWTRLFPDDWDICLLDAPGRGNAQALPLIADGAGLVAYFGEALAPLMDRPFAFFGHSVGARVAYGLTHHLADTGRRLPLWLGVSSFRAPSPPRRNHPSAAAWRPTPNCATGSVRPAASRTACWRTTGCGPRSRPSCARTCPWRTPGTTPHRPHPRRSR